LPRLCADSPFLLIDSLVETCLANQGCSQNFDSSGPFELNWLKTILILFTVIKAGAPTDSFTGLRNGGAYASLSKNELHVLNCFLLHVFGLVRASILCFEISIFLKEKFHLLDRYLEGDYAFEEGPSKGQLAA